ncbi:hypothetical protein GF322_04550 [Candidatus Dependentiae bacterium]|nr:hypothetical protein [Candidatus Dependentiae bacterium]
MQILYAFLGFIFLIILRLAYLQINQSEIFSDLGQKNFLITEVVVPQRGNLVDSQGVLLASNRPVYDLYWEGSGNRLLSVEQQELIKKLKDICQIKLDSHIEKIKNAEKYVRKILLKEGISFDQLCKICELCVTCSNLIILSRFKRIYPYKNLAGHVLGYLSKHEQDYSSIGLYGLERLFQDRLKGEVGYILNTTNSKGRKLNQKQLKDPKSGDDIKLTLDYKLQIISENLFEEGQSGAFILMNPFDGSIKSLVSYPNFDPNMFLEPISQGEWEEKFSVDKPLLNRVTNAMYPPASIFKLITFAAGLEEKVIDSNSKFNCKGFTKFCGRNYHCIRHWGHGEIDASAALAYSCNIPCYEIGLKIKINQLADYAYRFGLGRKTGLLLPESSGLMPTYEWKVAHKNEPWWKGETLSACIGQSYIQVTPLQVARMISGICSGYLVRPRILQDEIVQTEKLEITEETLDFLRGAMKDVVVRGSAKILNKLKDFDIYAKTGTAQTSSLQAKKISKEQLEHAWLASFFQYKDEDPLIIVVLVENVGSAEPAKKIAARFFIEYKKLKEKDFYV